MMGLVRVVSPALAIAVWTLVGCGEPNPTSVDSPGAPRSPAASMKPTAPTEGAPSRASAAVLDDLNARLARQGKDYRVAMMEYITCPASGQFGSTVFAKSVGNKQLAFHYVPGLLVCPGQLTYAVDTADGEANPDLGSAETEFAIDRAMQTWGAVPGSGLSLAKVAVAPNLDLGVVQFEKGYGGMPDRVADVSHAGWLPLEFFEAIAPGQGASILGATFTFIWVVVVDGHAYPVDTNGDGRFDAAFREIYYNDYFLWTTDPVGWDSDYIDVETIALHEAGHGLSQAHFGTIFNDGKGTREPGFQLGHLHFSPRAVMNALYWGTQRELLGTDVAGHLSIWATWPRF